MSKVLFQSLVAFWLLELSWLGLIEIRPLYASLYNEQCDGAVDL